MTVSPELPDRVAQLFRETGTAHHRAFADVNGEDAEWASWYAHRLAQPLGALLGRAFDVAQLARDLESAEAERRRSGASDWPRCYADWFLARSGGAPRGRE
jgi:hypothetical protein